ncbi:MAG: amino acid ABC transporter permease, partial [Roseburia sp.]
FGYCASDIPVHNYWVNAMGDNDIFVAGIYPFGFHCVIYYIHTVFGIETYVLMRLFGVVQTLLIHLVLLAFLRACCKSRYCAYTAVAVYVLANVFNPDIFKRYLSSLPQEFGMLFILPAVYFLFAFFAERKNEVAALEKGVKDSFFRQRGIKSSGYLWLFAMNFSLTVTVHFYDTMVTGILCIGIAIGYFFRLFRGRYFWRVMAAGLISVLVAVLPMAVAFIGGKPLQGSLGWGLSVITGSMESAEDTEEENGDSDSPETDTGGVEADSTAAGAGENGTNVEAADSGAKLPSHAGNTEPATETDNTAGESLQQTGQGFILLLAGKFQRLFRYMQENLRNYVFKYGLNREIFLGFFAVVWFDIVAGALLLFRKKRDYGARILSCGCAMALLFVILCAARIGIPAIMDTNRTRIYIVYLYPVLIAFALDVLLTLLFGWMKRKWLLYAASLATVAACIAVLVNWDMVRVPYVLSEAGLFERNEAIICLTNILRENENEKFTICSANDELRMVEDYGYHYEVITLLRSMEGANVVGNLVIPTERIYFFIEKKPLDYTIHYEGSGQMVSEEGASKPLPRGNGLSIYEGENRWIVMSRMYYWAQEFSRLYEKEMQVYYETDNFVCYVLEQNPYRLYDLSIDYGYN